MDTLLLPPFGPLPSPTPLHTHAPPLQDLAEPFLPSTPLPSLDQFTFHSALTSKKRKSLSDFSYQDQLIDAVSRSGWSSILMSDNIHTPNLAAFPQWANDCLESSQFMVRHDDEADNQTAMSAARNCANDLEDVLNLLWMEDDVTSAAQSHTAMPTSADLQTNSVDDQQLPLLVADFDWLAPESYSSDQASVKGNDELRNEDPSGGEAVGAASDLQDEKCNMPSSWPRTGACWQVDNSGVGKYKQQGVLQPAIRTSWQDGVPRVNWQADVKSKWEGEWQETTNWQRKQANGAARSNWQTAGKRLAVAAGGHDHTMASGGTGGREGGGAASCLLAWAGPTLLDIESALAMTEQSTSEPPTPSSTTGRHIPVSPFIDVKALLAQGDAPQLESETSSWRQKLQKRNSQEPKYTIKVESEEKALGDGYRWRKYGQKSIKNSPFPRSYYRCSTGKCNAKKQVERCQEEEGLFLVTYEGIHLHHKPIMLHKLRITNDGFEEEREKSMPSETEKSPSSPSSATSCSTLPYKA